MALPAFETFTASNNSSLPAAIANWTQVTGAGNLGVNSNEVYPSTATSECACYWNPEVPSADQYSQITLTTNGSSSLAIGPACRISTSAEDYYGYYSDNNSHYLFKVVGGTWTQLGTHSAGSLTPDWNKIEALGTTIRSIRNGVQTVSVTDSAISSGRLGITGYGNSTSVRADNWEGGNLSTTGTVTFVGAGTAVFGNTSGVGITPTLPSGWKPNDIHIIVIHTSSNNEITDPSGWTVWAQGVGTTGAFAAQNNTAAMRVETFWRRAVAGDTDPTVAAIADTNVRGAQIYGFRGCDPLAYPFASFSRNNGAASATVLSVDVTTLDKNALCIFFFTYEDDPNNGTQPTNFSTVTIAGSALGNDMDIGYATRTTTATGSMGTPQTVLSGGSFANSPYVCILAVLKAKNNSLPPWREPVRAITRRRYY